MLGVGADNKPSLTLSDGKRPRAFLAHGAGLSSLQFMDAEGRERLVLGGGPGDAPLLDFRGKDGRVRLHMNAFDDVRPHIELRNSLDKKIVEIPDR
jgi:hypothetical protein